MNAKLNSPIFLKSLVSAKTVADLPPDKRRQFRWLLLFLLLFLGGGLSFALYNSAQKRASESMADDVPIEETEEEEEIVEGLDATVTLWNQSELSGGKLVWKKGRVFLYLNPSTKIDEGIEVDLANVSKIEFLRKKPKLKKSRKKKLPPKITKPLASLQSKGISEAIPKPTPQIKLKEPLTMAEKRFLGVYRANVTAHMAILRIYEHPSARLGASIRFLDWGNRVEEILYHLQIKDDSIEFKRACYGKRCREIGSVRSINQIFFGTINSGNDRIVGNYQGGKNGSDWSAVRISDF